MDVNSLTANHREALLWFATRAGQAVGWPEPLESGQFLATQAKGIYRPAGWNHALSIKIIPGGPYPDTSPHLTDDGRWQFRYHQEEQEGRDPAAFKTNDGLMRCMSDGVPVGVIRRVKPKPGVIYEVLGLGLVSDWSGGFFAIQGPASLDGGEIGGSAVLPTFDPDAVADARVRTLSSITRRQGQPAFRAALIRAYEGRCAVTGCRVTEVLEAAHIVPYMGVDTNVVSNGVLLRSDLHTLFDLGLMTIDPISLTVAFSPELNGSHYAEFEGRQLAKPRILSDRPSEAALVHRQRV